MITAPTVRTRIAPSPTGMLHLGTARTALFCWAFARHHGGQFVLRIEDTDLERSTEAAVQVILDSMRWLDLDYDEGPFRQTHRLARYAEVIERLIAEGKAYRCYASREELDTLREAQMARGDKPRYDGRWRPENAAGRMPPAGVAPVIRFRNPDAGEVSWNDLVKGPIEFANDELDDLIYIEGLRQILESPALVRRYCVVEISMCGHHDDGQPRASFVQTAHQIETG